MRRALILLGHLVPTYSRAEGKENSWREWDVHGTRTLGYNNTAHVISPVWILEYKTSLSLKIQIHLVLKKKKNFWCHWSCFHGGINKTLRCLCKLGRTSVINKTRFNREHSTLLEQRQHPHLDRLFKSTLPEKHAQKKKVCHLFPSFALGCLVFVVSSPGKRMPLKCWCGVGATNNM